MERADRELIEKMIPSNFELKKLYEKHSDFEARLNKLGKKAFLTQSEELEQRQLKILKLRGVERMLKLAADGQEMAA